MRQHNTKEQKEQRKNAYWLLRNIAKLNVHDAMVFRDWSDNKIKMIIFEGAKPIPKW